MKKLLSVLVLGFLTCNISFADIIVSKYLKARENGNKRINEFMDTRIGGIGVGIFWSNASIEKEKAMYCPPPKMSFTTENYINFLDQEIEDQKNIGILSGEEAIGMMIIFHMREIFPCNKYK